jgi:hypothetical protein
VGSFELVPSRPCPEALRRIRPGVRSQVSLPDARADLGADEMDPAARTESPFHDRHALPRIRDLPQRPEEAGSFIHRVRSRISAYPRPVRLVAQDSALSRRRQGFDSPTGYSCHRRLEWQASTASTDLRERRCTIPKSTAPTRFQKAPRQQARARPTALGSPRPAPLLSDRRTLRVCQTRSESRSANFDPLRLGFWLLRYRDVEYAVRELRGDRFGVNRLGQRHRA